MIREYTKFGLLLRRAREVGKRHRVQVAQNVGRSSSFLARVERGDTLPSLVLLAALWKLLRFDANELFDALEVTVRRIPADLLTRRGISTRARTQQGKYVGFGSVVVRERVLVGLTQEALAYGLGIGIGFLSRVEAGLQVPSVLLAAKARKVLGLDGNEMLAALVDESPREPFAAFGQILEVARERRELRASEVAKAAQCSTAAYKEWERGRGLPTVLVLARMHRALGFNGNAVLHAVWLADSSTKEVA